MKRAALALFFSQLFAVAVFAQEYGRASGGDIDLITRHSQPLSGSLGFTAGAGKGFDLSLGGTLVKDRVWFFATGERNQRQPLFGPASQRQFTDAKLSAQLGDKQNLAASYGTLPSSFLSLHYTGIVSSNMYVTGSFSELKRSNAGF